MTCWQRRGVRSSTIKPIQLSRAEIAWLKLSAQNAQKIENVWVRRFDAAIKDMDEWVFKALWERGRFAHDEIDFLDLVIEHSYRTMVESTRDAEKSPGEQTRSALAGPPNSRIPRGLKALKEAYDLWRKRRNLTPRQKTIAKKMKDAYIKRVESIWERFGETFRQGKSYNLNDVREVLRKGDMAESRVHTIVQTETTHYYNKARRDLYDQSNDVTHYLFMSIRDQATTKWCKTRHGVVYAKGDPLLETETPPCHWNCRSEILPLTPQNPRHLALINDKSRARRHRTCEPLPPGWNRRAA